MLISLKEESQVTDKVLTKIEKSISQKDSVMLIHANWCGHCQQFMPAWEASEKAFAKANVTQIDIESKALDKVQQHKKIEKKIRNKDGMYFPMIIFFFSTGENKTAKKVYNGNRSQEDIQQFVQKHQKKYAAAKGGASKGESMTMSGGAKKGKGKLSKSVEHEVNEILNNYFKL